MHQQSINIMLVFRQQTSVVFVPSQRDVHHDYVYPQPPFPNDGYQDNKVID